MLIWSDFADSFLTVNDGVKLSNYGWIKLSIYYIIIAGAGFIGSYIAPTLCEENEVIVIDNLLTGRVVTPELV